LETRVVNVLKEEYDILIDRTTIWGNPFKIGKDGTRDEVIEKYQMWLEGSDFKDFKQEERRMILDNISDLRGKTLGCWCKPKGCHGDILASKANGEIHL
jgi:hypothetical protein